MLRLYPVIDTARRRPAARRRGNIGHWRIAEYTADAFADTVGPPRREHQIRPDGQREDRFRHRPKRRTRHVRRLAPACPIPEYAGRYFDDHRERPDRTLVQPER